MRFNNACVLVVIASALLACDKKPETVTQGSTVQQPAADKAYSGKNSDAAKAFADAKSAEAEKSRPDFGVPIENYTEIANTAQSDSLTYIAVAHGGKQHSDEELLNMFSGRYFNEKDAFKKNEMKSGELARIKDELSRYSAQRYYKIKVGQSGNSILPVLSLEPYNFETKSFGFFGGRDPQCFGTGLWSNMQNVRIGFEVGKEALCSLHIADLETAKAVEAARASGGASALGSIYFFVSSVEGNNIKATVSHFNLDVLDKPSYDKRAKVIANSAL